MNINLPLESLYQLKKLHQNPLLSFPSIQTDSGILFYPMLGKDYNILAIYLIIHHQSFRIQPKMWRAAIA